MVARFNHVDSQVASISFTVPTRVKEEFNRVFEGENRNAIITRLMRSAIAEVRLQKWRDAIFRQITAERGIRPKASDAAIAAARRSGRP
jgi:metal-responsive CopG/Arc/MetJ family transcriptional regulator